MATGDVKAFRENSSGSFDEIVLGYTDVNGLVSELADKVDKRILISTKTDSFTLAVKDAGRYIRVNKSTAATITIPYSIIDEYFVVGDSIEIEQAGAGEVRVVIAPGGTILGNVKTAGQYKSIRILCLGSDTYVIKDGAA